MEEGYNSGVLGEDPCLPSPLASGKVLQVLQVDLASSLFAVRDEGVLES